jgi:hypothetical protein
VLKLSSPVDVSTILTPPLHTSYDDDVIQEPYGMSIRAN